MQVPTPSIAGRNPKLPPHQVKSTITFELPDSVPHNLGDRQGSDVHVTTIKLPVSFILLLLPYYWGIHICYELDSSWSGTSPDRAKTMIKPISDKKELRKEFCRTVPKPHTLSILWPP